MRILRKIAALLSLTIVGCANQPQVPTYAASSAPSSTHATVSGSLVKRSWPTDNEVAWVAAVDGQPVRSGNPRAGRETFAHPLPVAEGDHQLTLAFSQGMIFATAQVGVRVRPRSALVVKVQTKDSTYMERASGKDYVLLWVEDVVTGQHVSEEAKVFIHY